MKVTNKTGLPQAIVTAVENDPYSRGDADISVTQLISPPRKVALNHIHEEQITEDASERIWALMGQSIHAILERANKTGIAERRLSVVAGGWKISAGMDLYEEGGGVLADYKVTSAWSVKNGPKEEWVSQLNVYAEILRQNAQPVTELKIIALLRDWSKLEAVRDPFYPQTQVVTFTLPLWDSKMAVRYIETRVEMHKQARVKLPECSPADRWAREPKWAVMRAGQDRAVKLYDNEFDAIEHSKNSNFSLSVKHRPGESVRCRFYCNVLPFCEQGKLLVHGGTK